MIHRKSELTPETRVNELQGWTILSPAQKEARDKYWEEQNRKAHKEKEFVFMRKQNLSAVKEGMSLSELGLLLFLSRYMRFNEGGTLKHEKEKLTVTKTARLVGKSSKQVKRILSELEKRSLLYLEKEGKKTYIELSDSLFVMGKLSDSDKSVKIFKMTLAEIAQELSLTELGFFLLLLPHMHWQTHLLCDNPDELETRKVVLWRRKDLTTELGCCSKDFAYRTLNKLGKLRVIAEIKTVNEGIALHPRVVSRQSITPSWNQICEMTDFALSKENYK